MNWRALTTSALFAVAIGAVAASAQTVETGFLNRTVLVDGVEYRYQVYVPRDFQRSTSWPVIVALHGGSNYGTDGLNQTAGALANAIRRHADRFLTIVVSPQGQLGASEGWHGKSGEAALAAPDRTIAEFNGDRSRVYLTGFSGGGHGAWYLASHPPGALRGISSGMRLHLGAYRWN